MSNVLYVSSANGYWVVFWQDKKTATRFNSRKEAIDYAKKLAKEALEGDIAEILWQRDDGSFQAEWTYGSDPYPPLVRTV